MPLELLAAAPCADEVPTRQPKALVAQWTCSTIALGSRFPSTADSARPHNGMASISKQVLGCHYRKDEALGYMDHLPVEAKIVELCEDFNVTRIACDTNYFTRSMLRLQNEHGLPIEEFKQNNVKM